MDTSFYDLPQEVLSLIFGYTAGVELVEISSLFRTVIPIGSKHLLHSLHDYIQQTPLEIDQTLYRNIDTRARAMAWACRKKIKLRKCHFVYKSSLDLCIIEYVLRSCDISNLDSFGQSYDGECLMDEKDYLILMTKQGFPRKVVVNDVDRRLKSTNEIRERILDALVHGTNKKKMRTMTLSEDIDWILRLLQHFQFLEALYLREYCSDFRKDTNALDMYNVLAAIEGLSSLRRLELINYQFFPVEGEKPLKIVSHTLECLCFHQSPTLCIEECVCPNLKVLSMDHSYSTRLVTELEEDRFPYGMQVRKVCDVIPSWNDASDVCVNFDFITRPIQKYICPDTCTVLFIPNAMDTSYDGDYYGSDLQDDDYEYLEDSEEEDDYYEDDEIDYEDDEFDNDMMNVMDDFEETTLLDKGEEDHENYHPRAFF